MVKHFFRYQDLSDFATDLSLLWDDFKGLFDDFLVFGNIVEDYLDNCLYIIPLEVFVDNFVEHFFVFKAV